MNHFAYFVTAKNNNYFKLNIGISLISFTEFDFSYFEEQCAEIAENSKISGEFSFRQADILKSQLIKCHPYCEALVLTDFEQIVLDYIINMICKSENKGLESLWVEYISANTPYQKLIFSRISEYKTSFAINQWINLMRMQDYACHKLAFIFEGQPTSPLEYKARKNYFDLSFRVSAHEIGLQYDDLSCMKCYNSSLMPNAPFILSKPAKEILKATDHLLAPIPTVKIKNKNKESMTDQMSSLVFPVVNHLKRPTSLEMHSIIESFASAPEVVYMPDSFKSIIDLEFDLMIKNEIFMEKSSVTGRYEIVSSAIKLPSVNLMQQISPEPEIVPQPKLKIISKLQPVTEPEPIPQNLASIQEPAALVRKAGRPKKVKSASEKNKVLTQNVNARCQSLYSALYFKVGKGVEEKEFKEWSQYLMNIRKNIIKDISTIDDLEDFLDSSEQLYKELLLDYKK